VGDFHLLFFASFLAHSVVGQNRVLIALNCISEIAQKADLTGVSRHVSNGPTADIEGHRRSRGGVVLLSGRLRSDGKGPLSYAVGVDLALILCADSRTR